MALTREERQTIETLIKKVRSLEDRVNTLENLLTALQKMVDGINAESNILDWSSDQISEWLKPYILTYMTNTGTKLTKHNHTNDQQGGDCFAKLGANLID
jgi:K+-sensing histidine kinase KdpD